MDLNWIVFPAPKNTSKEINFKLKQQFTYIPKPKQSTVNCSIFYNKQQNEDTIPCMFIQYNDNQLYSDKIMIFFHGNAEDLSVPNLFVNKLSENLGINILMVEYPGYSVYPGSPSAQKIEEDAQIVYDYLIKNGTLHQNIYVFGRSIGSGPSTFLARNNQIGLIVLMSAYTSIRDISKFLVGGFLSKLVKQRFENDKNITKIKCPLFLIHGLKDQVVPYEHSRQLLKLCTTKHLGFNFPQEMTHNKFLMNQDIIFPLQKFISGKNLQPEFSKKNIYSFLQQQKETNPLKINITIQDETQIDQ